MKGGELALAEIRRKKPVLKSGSPQGSKRLSSRWRWGIQLSTRSRVANELAKRGLFRVAGWCALWLAPARPGATEGAQGQGSAGWTRAQRGAAKASSEMEARTVRSSRSEDPGTVEQDSRLAIEKDVGRV